MKKTLGFRNQHEEIINLISEISSMLNIDNLIKDASGVEHLLRILLNNLTTHLSMEDKYLYPKLLTHHDEKIKNLAKQYVDEMGDIGEKVEHYKTNMLTVEQIQQYPEVFLEQTNSIFRDLLNRIEKENTELYETVDILD